MLENIARGIILQLTGMKKQQAGESSVRRSFITRYFDGVHHVVLRKY